MKKTYCDNCRCEIDHKEHEVMTANGTKVSLLVSFDEGKPELDVCFRCALHILQNGSAPEVKGMSPKV